MFGTKKNKNDRNVHQSAKGITFILFRKCIFRSSPPDMLFGKGVLKTCCKFTGKHLC